MRALIIIPAFNPPIHFNDLLSRINDISSLPIVVIDDGSKTPISIQNIPNIELIRNNRNRGKGYSLQKAFQYSYEKGYEFSITIDSDLQHDPSFIPDFINVSADYDLVFGKRDFNWRMPYLRRFSNTATSLIISNISGLKVYDSQCGYRRYNLSTFNSCRFSEKGFQFESEIIIKFSKLNAKFKHVNISTIYGNEKSSMAHFSDTIKFIKMIFKNLGS